MTIEKFIQYLIENKSEIKECFVSLRRNPDDSVREFYEIEIGKNMEEEEKGKLLDGIANEMKAFAVTFGLNPDELMTKGRKPDYVNYRAMMMERLYRSDLFSEAQVAALFNRDHSTLVHAKDKIIPTIKESKHAYYDKYKEMYRVFNEKFANVI